MKNSKSNSKKPKSNSKTTKKTIPTEGSFKKKVIKDLKKIPDLYYFIKEALALRGIPDIIICKNGLYVAWELKRSYKESLKKTGRIVLQKHNIEKIKASGGIGRIVYPENYEESLNELKSL